MDLPPPPHQQQHQLPPSSSSSAAAAAAAAAAQNVDAASAAPVIADAKDSPSGGSLGFGLSPQPPVDPTTTSTTSYDESDSPSGEKVSTQSPAPAGTTAGLPHHHHHHHKGALSEKKVSTPSVDELDSDWSDYPGNGELHYGPGKKKTDKIAI